ncbi:hypothetical protein EBZ80_21880 [bacterium]|nr:hypothetical protein [bacterium]
MSATPEEDPKAKPKADRVREGITILQKLKEVGIGPTEPAFAEIQALISGWVNTGEAVAKAVPLVRFDRVAHLVLPRRRTAVASLVLKTVS